MRSRAREAVALQFIPALVIALILAPFVPSLAEDAPAWSNAASPGGGPVQGIGGSSAVLVTSTWSNGAYRSYDGGSHWESIPDFPPVVEARVAFDPVVPTIGFVYGFGGVARTDDGGQTWTHMIDTPVTYRLAISPNGGVVASGRDNASFTELYYSPDRGYSWYEIGFPTNGTQFMSLYGLAFGDTDQHIVAMSISSMWRTSDGGATWTKTSHDFLSLERAPDGTLWGSGFSLAKSVDDGATWQSVSAPDTGWPIAVGADGRLFVPSDSGFLTSADGGASWEDLGSGAAAFGATQLLVDPADPEAVYVSDEFIGVSRIAAGSYQTRTTGLQPIRFGALGASADGSVLLAGSDLGAYASRDGGASWSHTGAGLGMNGVSAVAASADGSVLIVGGTTRVFWPFVASSRDGGATWDTVNPELGGDGRITGIAFDPNDAMHAFAAAWMDLANSALIETTNGGQSWTTVVELPIDVHDVAWDATVDAPLFGTTAGTFVYLGNGAFAPRAVGLDTFSVAARDGRSWSSGTSPSIWSGASPAPHAPWADTGQAIFDLAPESAARVWATNEDGTMARCVELACEDVSPPARAYASLVVDGIAFAATDDGIFQADIN